MNRMGWENNKKRPENQAKKMRICESLAFASLVRSEILVDGSTSVVGG